MDGDKFIWLSYFDKHPRSFSIKYLDHYDNKDYHQDKKKLSTWPMAIMQVNSGLHCPWRNGAYVCGDYFHILFPTIIVILTTKVMFKIKGSSRLLYSQTNKAWFFLLIILMKKWGLCPATPRWASVTRLRTMRNIQR